HQHHDASVSHHYKLRPQQRRPQHQHLLLALFFFQAEDGIRDRNVTGVQTCALPISTATSSSLRWPVASIELTTLINTRGYQEERSEERRVGKEGRAGWAADHHSKNA